MVIDILDLYDAKLCCCAHRELNSSSFICTPAKGADEDSWEDSWLTKFPARHQEKILCDVVAIGLLGVFS